MPIIQNRRQFLTTLSLAGAASMVRAPPSPAAEGDLETTTVRFSKPDSICIAPEYVADELLRADHEDQCQARGGSRVVGTDGLCGHI